jgi:molybdopterin-containing oxidoreductase family iron-sulfur binding subunit
MKRRDFLKVLGGSVLALDAASSGSAGSGPGKMSPGPKARKAKRWAMVVDMAKCRDDCPKVCISACHSAHNVPYIPNADDEVKWLFEKPYENAFPDTPREIVSEEFRRQEFLLLCNHCDDPPCVRACPTQATFKRQDGIVMMDYHRCIGCRFCIAACPYGARSFNFRDPRPFITNLNPDFPTRSKGVVEKCSFCQERLAVGLLPACVEACKARVLIFGDLRDPDSEVYKVLMKRNHIRRKPALGTYPSVFYLV